MDQDLYNLERDEMRRAVLDALDKWARNRFTNSEYVKRFAGAGWKDEDLSILFPALDQHFDRCLERFAKTPAKANGRD